MKKKTKNFSFFTFTSIPNGCGENVLNEYSYEWSSSTIKTTFNSVVDLSGRIGFFSIHYNRMYFFCY